MADMAEKDEHRAVEMTGPTTPTTSPWKSGNPKPGFPLSHRPHSPSPQTKNKTKKGGLEAVASLPPPGSFFNENMLRVPVSEREKLSDNYRNGAERERS
jgi:hypothetical protein